MKNKKELKDKIIQSVFMYETKRMTTSGIVKSIALFIIGVIILVFGGVILDIFIENGLGDMFTTNSSFHLTEISSVLMREIPQWLFLICLVGIIVGCILIGVVIKNRKLIFHKTLSILKYWFTL